MSYPGAPGGGYPGQNPYGGQQQPGAYGQPQPGAYGQPQPGAYGQPQPGAYGQQPGGYGRPAGPPQQHGGPPPGVNPEIYSWFRAVDQDNSGYINAQELSRALQSGNNKNFSIQACSTMMGMFDHSRSGRIDVNQFSQLFAFIGQWTEAFKNADKDNSGSINAGEITAVLQQQGYNLTPQTIQVMIQKYGAAAGGPYGGGQTTLGLDGFILVNSQLRKLTEVFRQKDTAMQGRVTLSYEEFVGMAMSATV